jgi:hypothetical protein
VTWFVGVIHVTKVIVKNKNELLYPGIELGTWHEAQNVTDLLRRSLKHVSSLISFILVLFKQRRSQPFAQGNLRRTALLCL